MLGLMALLMGFTFSMAFSKFEKRREVIVEEANDIGTAILRADLFPDSVRKLFYLDFSKYVEARIAYYDAGVQKDKMDAAMATAIEYSDKLWKRAADLSRDAPSRVSYMQMIPALNNMIDIASVRQSGIKAKVPPFILLLLVSLTLMCSFMLGYGQKGNRRDPILVGLFSLMTTVALYLILELDRPRRGMLNLNEAEQQMVDLREILKTRIQSAPINH